jgi:tRNA uridine 5-carboxymethylaminomethyl modification enzyme
MSEEEVLRVLGQPLAREQRAFEALKRPEVSYQGLASLTAVGTPVTDASVAEQVEIQAKYAGYIARQHDEIDRTRRHEETRIPHDLDYATVRGLSNEVRQKLTAVRPHTLGQAGRISGVTPAALSLLLVHLKRRDGSRRRAAAQD